MSPAPGTAGADPAAPAADPRPMVSVVMIFLNAGDFIAEAIDSVLAQTCPHWELLLVDDGSTDQSTRVAQDYCRRFPERIRYLEHPGHANRGMSASRNLGIAASRGDFVCFLDADDVFLPQRLERHLAVLMHHPDVGAVQSQYEFWYSWQAGAQRRDEREESPVGDRSGTAPERLLMNLLLDTRGATATGICNLTFRREVLQAVGGFEESFRGLYEDQVIQAKLYLGARVYVLNDCLARYRQHRASVWSQAKENAVDLRGKPGEPQHVFLEWLDAYMRANAFDDAGLRRSLDQWLRVYRPGGVFGAGVRIKRKVRGVVESVLPATLASAILDAWRRRRTAQVAKQIRRARSRVAGAESPPPDA